MINEQIITTSHNKQTTTKTKQKKNQTLEKRKLPETEIPYNNKRLISHENVAILNVCSLNNRDETFMNHNPINLKGEVDKFKSIVRGSSFLS